MSTIFISIASYRDSQCEITLSSLYRNASNPQNVFVGICQQNDPSDPECDGQIDQVDPQLRKNIRMIRIPSFEATGPTKARYLCSTLYNNEDYYLQIDSHTKFTKGWDTKLIQMIQDIKQSGYTQKPVVSSYPPSSEHYDKYTKDSTVVPRICESTFNNRGMLSFTSSKHIDTQRKFYRTPFIAAGFFFCPGSFVKELPFDPELPHLFQGEEILLSARFYTHGWDVFTPNENVIFHQYTREDAPKFWDDKQIFTVNADEDAHTKVKQYLQLTGGDRPLPDHLSKNMSKYGLGSKRTIQDFYKFSGVDTQGKKTYKNFCNGDLKEGFEEVVLPSKVGGSMFTHPLLWICLLIFYLLYKYRK